MTDQSYEDLREVKQNVSEEEKGLKEEEILLGSGSRKVGLALNGFAAFG